MCSEWITIEWTDSTDTPNIMAINGPLAELIVSLRPFSGTDDYHMMLCDGLLARRIWEERDVINYLMRSGAIPREEE